MIRQRSGQQTLWIAPAAVPVGPRQAFYDRLSAVVGDWGALAAPLAAAFSATTGRPTDPVVYLKAFLVGYLENVTYDTALAERLADSFLFRRLLGYALDERTPDHSTLSRVRAQLMRTGALQTVLEAVVARCVAAGLVTGAVVAVDATILPAHASLDSVQPLTVVQSVATHVQATATANPDPDAVPPPQGGINARRRSTTDPDARLLKRDGQRSVLGYRVTHVTDGAGQVILAVAASHGDGDERQAATPVLEQAQATLAAQGQTLGLVVGDTGYDGGDLAATVEALGGQLVTFPARDGHPKGPGYLKADFTYDAVTATYQCPHGQVLARWSYEPPRRRWRYRSDAAACATCPARAACLAPGGRVRWLARLETEDARARMQTVAATPAGQAALAARKGIVEGAFGHHKAYGGLSRVNCRGLAKVQAKALCAAIAWNLIRLVTTLGPSLRLCLRVLALFRARMPRGTGGTGRTGPLTLKRSGRVLCGETAG